MLPAPPDTHPLPQTSSARVWPSFGQESRATLALAIPLIAGQVGQMLMGIADTVMVGRLGVTELGAVTFGNTLVSVPFVLGIGLLSSVSVRVSQARGAECPEDAHEALRHGTWLALAFGLLVAGLMYAAIPFLGLFQQPAEVTAIAPDYLLIVAASLVPALLTVAWKNHADALNHPWPAFWIVLGGILLNVFLNWLWIYGKLGFPALGLAGAAWATLAARVATVVALYLWLVRARGVREWMPRRWLQRCNWGSFLLLLSIGIPASLQLLTEVTAFSASSLLIGTLGAVPLAAHQVAITCAATTFMLPLGVAMAMTVRVGEVAGAREWPRMHRVLLGGWMYATGCMAVTMVGFLVWGRWIAGQFVHDRGVVEIAAGLLIIAGIFQLFDGLQVVSAGALRGVGDVRVPAWIALVAYWGLALPVGATLGLGFGWGASGMWTGLAAGLAVAALALGRRAWTRLQSTPSAAD